MKQLYLSILLSYLTLVASELITNSTDLNATEIQIKALQKEKDDLYNKINVAIEESITALSKANDSDSEVGLHHLKELKNQVKTLNEDYTTDDEDGNVISVENKNATNLEARRVGRVDAKLLENRFKNKKQRKLEAREAERARISFSFKKQSKKLTQPKPALQVKVEQDIREWIAKKLEEKEKIKKYRESLKLQDAFYEKCPRFGIGKKKKKGGRHYPCCRKCCKKSYLGCL